MQCALKGFWYASYVRKWTTLWLSRGHIPGKRCSCCVYTHIRVHACTSTRLLSLWWYKNSYAHWDHQHDHWKCMWIFSQQAELVRGRQTFVCILTILPFTQQSAIAWQYTCFTSLTALWCWESEADPLTLAWLKDGHSLDSPDTDPRLSQSSPCFEKHQRNTVSAS